MSGIISVTTNFPRIYADQEDIAKEVASIWPSKKKYVEQFHQSSKVKGRHLSIPLEEYRYLGDIGMRSLKWTEVALDLQVENIGKLLKENELNPNDIHLIASTTVTGISIPTLEAKILNRLPLNPNIKRLPIFGLGCLGGVAGLNRVHDYLKGHPKEAAILLATELCTLTFQFHDMSTANLVGTSLFGDGAAAVLMVGCEHPLYKKAKFKILDGKSYFYLDTERVMGWDIVSSGFQIVLSGDVPLIVSEKVGPNIQEFLNGHDLKLEQIDFYVSHPGGPKVLEKIQEVSLKSKDDFKHSWNSLSEKGNMSSVSVLHVLEKTIKDDKLKLGHIGMMLAMGPAFCSEFSLLKKV